MRRRTRNSISLATSLSILLFLLLSIAISPAHSHADGCAIHYDCAACLWICESAAVAVLFWFLVNRMSIGVVRPIESSIPSILVVRTRNGRAPPFSLA